MKAHPIDICSWKGVFSMKKTNRYRPWYQRLLSVGLAALIAFGAIPLNTRAETTAQDYTQDLLTTVADPQTIGRPGSVYGDNTLNAGKVTVGKSVHDGAVTVSYGNKSQTFTPGENNFIVTASQASQVVSVASESSAPVDVVFVLDTSGSMSGRVTEMVNAANAAIKSLLQANENNRVAVVAFSGTSGGGTSGGAAANVLTPLAHYNGDGETSHLTYTGGMIYGRGGTNNSRWSRAATSQGTNIHAGVIVGAKQLMDATDITIQTADGKSVTRIPFLVIMSDGQPSYAASGANWYDPSLTSQLGNLTNLAGLGFLPALSAAYYKGAITDKYFGAEASENNRCFVYTMGLGLTSLSNDQQNLALMTVDPKNATNSNSYYKTFEDYWKKYETGNSYEISVSGSNPRNYTITKDSITATKNYVNGKRADGTSMGYTGGYKYNDKYFSATQASDLAGAFDDIVVSIQQQAMSSPTRVETVHGADFSGYVTYTDPIGEYMEVKQVYGVLADGNYYQGKSFAQYISDWDNAPADFKTHMIKVLKERCKVTGATMSDAQAEAFLKAAAASANQANYDPATGEFDNSIVWWGKSYTAEGEEDVQIQWMGFADNDTVEYITDANTAIPSGADYVCRSYYYHGTAGGAVEGDNEYLHMVVRVQRSLKAPYQETVVISVPASLLSMEKVVVTEKTTNGRTTYTAVVSEADPARVVYEVGLRSDINAFNVDRILAKDANAAVNAYDYTAETAGGVSVNYDAATGTYYFYTNDWDRTQSESSHHRAMTHATFDAAADNDFYTYTKDTPIYTKNGNNYTLYNGTAKPVGEYYYAREYYDWSASDVTGNTHTAVKKTEYILVDIPASTEAVKKGTDSWYIAKGAYKASSLSSAVEDLPKSENRTGTSTIVVHPHRTENENNSHYTVLLGNNGKLAVKAADTKSVMINAQQGTQIRNDDGKVVMVGDELTYTIQVVNNGTGKANAVVTDKIPTGTEFVSSEGGSYNAATNTITWNIDNIEAGKYVEVSFTVVVTEAALTGELGVSSIDNAATVTLSNDFSYTTNTTTNPPEGKKMVDTQGNAIQGSVAVPDVLVYRIRWHNDSGSTATVTINDIIPAGTSYVANSASHEGVYDAEHQTVTWTLENVAAGASGVVSFRVNVNADAGETIENGAEIKIGDNDPRVTNKTSVDVAKGELTLSKTVAGYPAGAPAKTFTLNLTEIGLGMNGNYPLTKNGVAVPEGITFTGGIATVTITDGDTLVIGDITAGAIISVSEAAMSGFTPVYVTAAGANSAEGRVTIVEDDDVSVSVTNTYMPKAVEFELTATKRLDTNFAVGEHVFGFTAYPCSASGVVASDAVPLTGEVAVSGAEGQKTGTIRFGAVKYDAVGSYHYLIREINGGVVGVNYTTAEYIVKVEVTDNGSGQLAAKVVAVNGNDVTGEDAGITFVNTYAPLDTQITLEATKNFTGRDLRDGEFTFVVKDGNNNEITYGTNDANGNVTFRPITYTAQDMGTHTYTITENIGSAQGVTYSTVSHTVVVTVSDNGGVLVARVTSVNGVAADNDYTDDVVFTNVYTPTDATLNLEANKSLVNNTGDNGYDLKAEQFAFQVLDQNGNQVAFGTNDAAGEIKFSPIVFTRSMLGDDNTETFIYTVKELIPDELGKDPSIKYDETVYTVTVTVTYNTADGKLYVGNPAFFVEGSAKTAISFSNIQQPTYIDVEVKGLKQTENPPVGQLSFSFSVVDMNGNLAAGGSAPANGAVSFTNLTFTKPGTYYYWIYETNHAGQTAHGITYSGARYLMEVVIDRDSDSVLTKTVNYYPAGLVTDTGKTPSDYVIESEKITEAEAATQVLFQNVYNAKGLVNITAKKNLSNKTMVAGDFMFKLDRLTGKDDHTVLSTLYATNSSAGDVAFPSIIFENTDLVNGSATFYYVMSEVVTDANRLPGVDYSEAVYYLTVTLTDDGEGNISHLVQYYTDSTFATLAQVTVPEFNNSYSAIVGTQATFRVNKQMVGRDMQPDEFSFLLYHVSTDAEGNPVETLVDIATNTVNDANKRQGGAVFIRNYPATVAPGTYKYAIVEYNNSLGGVTYSTAKYWALVTISDNGSGTLQCSGATYYADEACTQQITEAEVLFVNNYQPSEISYTPNANKILNNRNMEDGEFAFTVTQYGSDHVVSVGRSQAAASGISSELSFTPINYTFASLEGATSKTFVYEIKEVTGNLTGVSYDSAKFYLQVVLTDKLDGTMDVSASYFTDAACTTAAADVTFVNVFTPSSVTVQLEATKVLRNHPMRQGNFSFLVYDFTDGRNDLVATGGNAAADADQTVPVTFTTIGYKFSDLGGAKEKAFYYAIFEQATTLGGVTSDETVYFVKVLLKHNDDGTLTTDVSYYTDQACTIAISGSVPAFVNTYKPQKVDVVLYADKTLINKELQTGEFTFTLSGNGVEKTATNDANGRATFGTLTFDAPGVYKYTITEKVTDAAKASLYTLDNAFHAYVVVEDNLRGQLVATVSYHEVSDSGVCGPDTNLGGAEFINYYTAPAIKVDLSAGIDAEKQVDTPNSGITYSPEGFTFQVTDTTGKVIKGWDENGNEVDMIGVSAADGTISFPKFQFAQAGEYHYWISEVAGNETGMTYDQQVWELHILVRYSEQTGLLYVDSKDITAYHLGRGAAEKAAPVFTNVFDPAAVTLTLDATKVLEGRDLIDREFMFYLMEGNVIVAHGHNDVNGKIHFALNYTAEDLGDHVYTIREEVPENADNGITYDSKVYSVGTVSVTYDENSHRLVASFNGTTVTSGATVVTGVTITNQYATEDAAVAIHANKVITGNRVPKDQEFIFVLTDSEGNVVAEAKNDAAGLITFLMTYEKAGVYTYTISEKAGDDSSITYDETKHAVTVIVTDDRVGKLHATVTYADDVVPTFINQYKARATSALISATKKLVGNKTLAAGEFTFELEREDGVKVTTTNQAAGAINFSLGYSEPGVYTYILREIAGTAAGVTYDAAQYKIIVVVIDDNEGSLQATVTYEGLEEDATPIFVNSYKGKSAAAQITATKTLTGKTLTADAYSFTLTNKDNSQDVYTAKNDAQGNVVFDLELTEVGTYTYILAEAAGSDANTTYDKNTYIVTIKVTDDLQGSLKAEVTYDTADGKAPTFQNVYTPSAITVELKGEKTLKGRDLKADEFSFQVTDSQGNVVATAKNDAKGQIVFTAISLKTEGKYTLTVTEVKGSEKGMIYDETKHTVTVEVTNENGQLKATVTEPKGGLVFENTYKNPDPSNPSTGDDMPLFLLVGLMVVSGGAVVYLLADRKKRSYNR